MADAGQCAINKEEVSSSLLGRLAPPFLCYKHIPSSSNLIGQFEVPYIVTPMRALYVVPLLLGHGFSI